MKKQIAATLSFFVLIAPTSGAVPAETPGAVPAETPQAATIVLRAATVLDGRGEALTDRDIVIRGDRIEAVVPAGQGRGTVVYEFNEITLLPGLIDTHVHMEWHFDRSGKLRSRAVEETPEEAMLYAAENAWVTLQGGVTTVQSVGSRSEGTLRDAIERGLLPGPRILASLGSIGGRDATPAELRARVAQFAERGADLIKVFASASIRVGGTPTLSQEQLDAICGEATARGLRTIVHAHGPVSAQRTARAGCTAVEHGALLDRETFELLAEHGLYYDPNIDLIFRNYFENEDKYLGIGSYTEEGFEQMRQAVPKALAVFHGVHRRLAALSRTIDELLVVTPMGAGYCIGAEDDLETGHGQGLPLCRQPPWPPSRFGWTTRSARSRLVSPPTSSAPTATRAMTSTALGRVRFVMKGGRVYRNDPAER